MAGTSSDQNIIMASLNAVEWGFANSHPAPLDGIHPYPAKFIADIPRQLLKTLPIPAGTVVFDPFCGSGTTLSVAQELGFASIGVDLNPIACLLARVKTGPFQSSYELYPERLVKQAEGFFTPVDVDIPNVNHWFEPEVQYAIVALRRAIMMIPDLALQDIMNLALSAIIVRVSNQESDTRYAAVQKKVSADKTFQLFLFSCKKIFDALKQREWEIVPATVLHGNTLELSPQKLPEVGILITSPPYPNAYEYWLYHKYRMWWLGYDPLFVKSNEIGARAHFFSGSGKSKKTDFAEQMTTAFELFKKIVVPGGYICFVIGRSKIHGEIIDNALTVENISRKLGLKFLLRKDREILAKRKSFNLSHAKIKTESILIMQRG